VLALRFWRIFVRNLKLLLLKRALKGDPANAVESEKRVETLLGIITLAGKVAILIIVGLTILRKINIEIGPIIASLGIFGLAVGFGAQELVRDIVTGFFILLENHIRTGDVAIINGTAGLVEEISLRTIILRDQSGTTHVFQNGKINTLSNMTKGWSAAVFDIGVAYKENTDEVSRVMEQVGATLQQDPDFKDKILQPIEILGVDAFGTNAVVIKARLKTMPSQQWITGREYRRRLKFAFDEKGIQLPFPHSTIYWGDDTKPLQIKMIEQDKE
jgi:small conductance mechanosensitive channel